MGTVLNQNFSFKHLLIVRILDFQFKITNGPEEHISRTSEKLTKRTFQGANQSPGQKGPTRFDQTELESEFIF